MTEQLFGGMLGIVIALAVLLWVAVWVLFPFLVLGRMKELIKEQQETNRRLLEISTNTRRAAVAEPPLYYADPAVPPPLYADGNDQGR